MKIAIVGATGLVGNKILEVINDRNFQFDELILTASNQSIGKKILFQEKEYELISIEEAVEAKPDIAIFSAGGSVSKSWAEKFASNGTTVIDNSSAWRMDNSKKLIVPEVNGQELCKADKIIANPNCSTIQMVVALGPLHQKYKIKRLVISTYQSITGTGVKAIEQLHNERNNIDSEKVYPHEIDLNCFPHGGNFLENGYTEEEMKLVNETRKILNDNSIQITATVVRIPVMGGHSEAVNIEFENKFELEDIYNILSEAEGITILDNPTQNIYPMPKFAEGKDDVFVGRIRKDISKSNSLDMWIVSDNLRKGAATNAVQIAEIVRNL